MRLGYHIKKATETGGLFEFSISWELFRDGHVFFAFETGDLDRGFGFDLGFFHDHLLVEFARRLHFFGFNPAGGRWHGVRRCM
jgi:hypothetical protein